MPRWPSALVAAAVALSSLVLAGPSLAESATTTIGISQGGQPLVVYHLGDGDARVLVLGGQHGGPEANTVELATNILAYFEEHPDELPPNVGLDVLPAANPDGLAASSRQLLSGVDPNRNWGGSDWQSNAYDSNGRYRVGLGGPEPFSEPETRALADWVLASRPALVINYHSAGGFMFGGRQGLAGELSSAYAEATGYAWPQPGQRSPLPYTASGSMNVWLREMGIPGLLVELSTPWGAELDRNLAGLKAVLARLADEE